MPIIVKVTFRNVILLLKLLHNVTVGPFPNEDFPPTLILSILESLLLFSS